MPPPAISLQGWDTANAVSFDVANSAIRTQGKTPKAFVFTPASGSGDAALNGAWDTWRLVPGGSGQTLQMTCPIKSGTADFTNANTQKGSVKLDPTKSTVQTIAFSLDALTVSSSPSTMGRSGAFANLGQRAGKYYFEVTLGADSDQVVVGIASTFVSQGNFAATTGAYAYRSTGYVQAGTMAPSAYLPTGGTATAATPGAVPGESCALRGNVIGVAVDLDNRKIWFRANSGAWQGVGADPVTGTGKTFQIAPNLLQFPAVAVGPGDSLTVNFGNAAFKHAVPAGFRDGWYDVPARIPLDGGEVHIQIQLAQFSNSAKLTDFMVDASGTAANPAVTVTNLVAPKGSSITTTQSNLARLAFADWFNANIAQFGNVFHTVNLNAALATGQFGWMKPTKADYAVADVPSSTSGAPPTQGVFSVLSLTEQNTGPASLSAQIDPAIIGDLPTGTNSVFAISAERFTSKILFESAQIIMVGSTKNDFDLTGLGLVITNNKALPWRQINLEDGTTVTPTVPAQGLKIRVNGRTIEVELKGATFDHPGWKFPGHEIITIDLTQNLYLVLKQRKDGKNVLVVQNGDPTVPNAIELPDVTNFVINYTLDQTALTFQKAMEWTAIGLSILTVGLGAFSAGAWIVRNGQLAAKATAAANAGNGVADLNSVPLNPIPDAAGQLVINGNVYASADSALAGFTDDAAQAVATGAAVGGGQVLLATKVAIATAVAAAVSGLGMSAFWTTWALDQVKALSAGDVDKLKTGLTFQAFLDEILAAYEWPGTANWALKDVRLAESLLLYGDLK